MRSKGGKETNKTREREREGGEIERRRRKVGEKQKGRLRGKRR